MKKSLITLSIVFTCFNIFAQCKADALAEKRGAVVQKEYVNISKMDRLTIVVEYVTDLNSNQKLSAVDFEYDIPDNGGSVSTLIDADELDALISFLQNLQDNITKAAAPKNYTEYTYKSLSGFEAGCDWEKGWKTYIKIDTDDSKTNVDLSKDDMTAFISFLKQAKAKL